MSQTLKQETAKNIYISPCTSIIGAMIMGSSQLIEIKQSGHMIILERQRAQEFIDILQKELN